jgi:hypothetical protein
MALVAGLAMIGFMAITIGALFTGIQLPWVGPNDGDYLLVFLFVGWIPVAIASAGAVVLFAAYKARRRQ